jgi:exopolyphosphatase/guanosine-5'-triphosphate,3'-diphosphate pyrophosphatase
MPTIIPRWEWRTFDGPFGVADDLLTAEGSELIQESDELYLLSTESNSSVKVRDDLMDVKHLERVDEAGLEQWKPILKNAFPLPAATVTSVLEELGAAVPTLERAEYTLDQLVEEVFGRDAALSAVKVHKRRVHHKVDGCMVEMSEISTGAGSRQTIAIESEDPALVVATVDKLELNGRTNTNLPRGLKELEGFGV